MSLSVTMDDNHTESCGCVVLDGGIACQPSKAVRDPMSFLPPLLWSSYWVFEMGVSLWSWREPQNHSLPASASECWDSSCMLPSLVAGSCYDWFSFSFWTDFYWNKGFKEYHFVTRRQSTVCCHIHVWKHTSPFRDLQRCKHTLLSKHISLHFHGRRIKVHPTAWIHMIHKISGYIGFGSYTSNCGRRATESKWWKCDCR